MKTLADFKRLIKVGAILHTIYHVESKRDESGKVIYAPDGLPEYVDKDMGEAPVSIVQSTQFAVERIVKGEKRDSWLTYPKASDCKVNDNSITIFEDSDTRGRIPVLTYTVK